MKHQTSTHQFEHASGGDQVCIIVLFAIQIRSKCPSVQTIMNSLKFGLLVILCFLVIDQSQCVPNCKDCWDPCGRGKNTEGIVLMPISLLRSFRTFQKHFGLCDFLTKSFTTAIFLGN